MKFSVALLCFFVYVQAVLGDTDTEAWDKFKVKRGKIDKDGPPETIRKTIFISRRRTVEAHNKKHAEGQVKYTIGLGEYADLPIETIRKFRNGRKPQEKSGKQAAPAPRLATNLRGAIPASVNWIEQGVVTYIKNQKSCGSCYAFSTAAYLESQILKAGLATNINFSPQQTVDCSINFGNNGCGGGLETNTFRYVKRAGQQNLVSYPYVGRKEACTHKKTLNKVNVTAVYSVPDVTVDDLKYLVATRGPICVGMNAADSNFNFYTQGIYSCPGCGNTYYDLDHAVLVVGYGEENGTEYWLVKNSWGTGWGESGFFRIAMANNDCGILTDITYADWEAL